jgi:hypothetical protein
MSLLSSYQLAFLTMTYIRHFWVASIILVNQCRTIKTMWKAIFRNKLTIYKANLLSFVQKIIKSRCYVNLSRRFRLKCHPKMAARERLIALIHWLIKKPRQVPYKYSSTSSLKSNMHSHIRMHTCIWKTRLFSKCLLTILPDLCRFWWF